MASSYANRLPLVIRWLMQMTSCEILGMIIALSVWLLPHEDIDLIQ